MLIIRNETKDDRQIVETMTRKAFYNLYVPGCTEHYLVHIMREHEDFIPELDFVAELDGQIVANVMYTKAVLKGENGAEKPILTFGPISVLPGYQRMGYGKQLLEHSFQKAVELGYDTIVIFGNPANYVSRGFQSCKKHQVSLADGRYPAAMLVKELIPGALEGKHWVYQDSPLMQFDEEKARQYDDSLEKMEKKHLPSQEEFYILSHSFID